MSELITKSSSAVPPIVVDAAERLLTVSPSTYASSQKKDGEPRSYVAFAAGIKLEMMPELAESVSTERRVVKRSVVVALAAKKYVEVAYVVEAFVAKRFVLVALVVDAFVAKRYVLVAAVVKKSVENRFVAVSAVEEAWVAVSRESALSKVRPDESMNCPPVVMNGTRPLVSDVRARVVEVALVARRSVTVAIVAVSVVMTEVAKFESVEKRFVDVAFVVEE